MRYGFENELRKVVTSKFTELERLLLTPRILFKYMKTMSKAKSLKLKRSTCKILVTKVCV